MWLLLILRSSRAFVRIHKRVGTSVLACAKQSNLVHASSGMLANLNVCEMTSDAFRPQNNCTCQHIVTYFRFLSCTGFDVGNHLGSNSLQTCAHAICLGPAWLHAWIAVASNCPKLLPERSSCSRSPSLFTPAFFAILAMTLLMVP